MAYGGFDRPFVHRARLPRRLRGLTSIAVITTSTKPMDTTKSPVAPAASAQHPETPFDIAPHHDEHVGYLPCDSRGELDAAYEALVSCRSTRQLRR